MVSAKFRQSQLPPSEQVVQSALGKGSEEDLGPLSGRPASAAIGGRESSAGRRRRSTGQLEEATLGGGQALVAAWIAYSCRRQAQPATFRTTRWPAASSESAARCDSSPIPRPARTAPLAASLLPSSITVRSSTPTARSPASAVARVAEPTSCATGHAQPAATIGQAHRRRPAWPLRQVTLSPALATVRTG
jgi:hypothetical protein